MRTHANITCKRKIGFYEARNDSEFPARPPPPPPPKKKGFHISHFRKQIECLRNNISLSPNTDQNLISPNNITA